MELPFTGGLTGLKIVATFNISRYIPCIHRRGILTAERSCGHFLLLAHWDRRNRVPRPLCRNTITAEALVLMTDRTADKVKRGSRTWSNPLFSCMKKTRCLISLSDAADTAVAAATTARQELAVRILKAWERLRTTVPQCTFRRPSNYIYIHRTPPP